MTAFVVTCVVLYLFALVVAWWTDCAESIENHVARALDDPWLFDAPEFTDNHAARFETTRREIAALQSTEDTP